jgi:Tfp pilus assembly protein PilV
MKRLHQFGFGLVETIVATGLFVVVTVTSVSTVIHSYSVNRLGDEQTEASLLAQQGIEAARSIKNQSWQTLTTAGCDSGCGLDDSAGFWQFSGLSDNLGKFTREVIVSDVYRNASDQIVVVGGTLDEDTKKITSKVSWDFSSGRSNEVEQNSYLAYYEQPTSSTCYTSHWPMDENSGSTIADIISGHNGLISGANWTSGKINSALNFDGNDDRAVVADDNNLDLTSAGTISAWVKADTHKPFAGIVHKGHQPDWSDEVYSLQFWYPDGTVSFVLRNGLGIYDQLNSTYGISTGEWHHLVVTWNMDYIRLYIDGVQNTYMNNNTGFPRISDGKLVIGAQLDVRHWYYGYIGFDGIIDDVRLYCSTLADDEIADLYFGDYILIPEGDASVRLISPTTNYGNTDRIFLGQGSSGLFRFNVSKIPANATITSAKLSLYSLNSLNSGTKLKLHQILSGDASWNESTSTWSHQIYDSLVWAGNEGLNVANTDYAQTAESEVTGRTTAGQRYEWTINPSVVQSWVSNSSTNYGLILRSSSNSVYEFATKENSDINKIPQIIIEYTTP